MLSSPAVARLFLKTGLSLMKTRAAEGTWTEEDRRLRPEMFEMGLAALKFPVGHLWVWT